MKSVLLDTTAYSHLMRGETKVLDALAEAETVFMSLIVMGELNAGFASGTRKRENKDLLDKFLRKPTVKTLTLTAETAEIFGDIKHRLRQAGTPVPINDVWIAAQTQETGSLLISYDQHFRIIPGIRLLDLQ
jgi:tRNA(fMet)-specific endonuclease VapC